MDDEQERPMKDRVLHGMSESIDRLLTEVTKEKLSLTRLSAYATAGLSFAGVLVLVAMDSLSLPLLVAAYSYALAIPLLVFMADLHEKFLWHGEKSFSEYKEMAKRPAFQLFLVSGYCLFALGFFSMVWHLCAIASVIAFILSFVLLSANNFVDGELGKRMEGKKDGSA